MNSPFSNSNKYAAAYVRWVRTDEPRTQRKPALSRIINPRQTVGPAYGKHAASRWSAESAANSPAAHGNTPNRTPRLSHLRALGARPRGSHSKSQQRARRQHGRDGARRPSPKSPHHVLDLVFFSGTLAHYRELNLTRREFTNHEPALRARHERRATSWPVENAAVMFCPNHTVSMPTHVGLKRSTTAPICCAIFSKRCESSIDAGVDTQP